MNPSCLRARSGEAQRSDRASWLVSELFREAEVVSEHVADVVDAVPARRHPVDAEAEREPAPLLRIDAAGTQTLRCTTEHPFWVEGAEWVAAQALRAGDQLVTPEGNATVSSVEIESQETPVQHYNFEVADWHTYFVVGQLEESQAQPVLTHNQCSADELAQAVQILREHSSFTRLVAREIDAGRLTPELARLLPHKHILTQSVGFHGPVEPDTTTRAIEPGDVFVLCSDGMTDPLDDEAIRKRGFKVVVDAVNSTGAISIPPLLERLGVETILINGEVTGEFAHNPEPLPENLKELSTRVVEEGADFGIAVDPDVDPIQTHRGLGYSLREDL